jgi:phosphate-selective porin OprO/OprP
MRSFARVGILSFAAAFASAAAAQDGAGGPEAAGEQPHSILRDGAPELATDSGWSIKPRGRLQLDAGWADAPEGVSGADMAFTGEVRRAYIGVDGTAPGGFGYRAEIDVARGEVEITDLYLTYDVTSSLTLTAGQHKPFWGLEEMTSDLFPSFTERAALNNAFGHERRVGASAEFARGAVLVQGGVFADRLPDLDDQEHDALSFDARAVFMPRLAGGQLHLGGSVHLRDLNGIDTVRYRVRPLVHTPNVRPIDTGRIAAEGEAGYGLEAAYIAGPFHAAAETRWQRVDRTDGRDPTFFGYSVEAGLFLTEGDTRGYGEGEFKRTRPAHPVGQGGIGAVQVNARYDYLDLDGAGIAGGRQQGYELSLVWTPTAYSRFIANYGRMQYAGAAVPAADGNRSYGVDAFGARAQFDF